jgi:hypothetical protein
MAVGTEHYLSERLPNLAADKPATRTVLLHMEDFKIPENLSRFAVKCGMWGFIKQMAPHMTRFINERRDRGVHPDKRDPFAFGAPSATSEATPGTTSSTARVHHSMSDGSLGSQRRSTLRKVASAVVAGSMLLALGNVTARSSETNFKRRARCGASASLQSLRSIEDDDDVEEDALVAR